MKYPKNVFKKMSTAPIQYFNKSVPMNEVPLRQTEVVFLNLLFFTFFLKLFASLTDE